MQYSGIVYCARYDIMMTVKDVTKMDLTQMISPEELALVKANGLDLGEVVKVGDANYPRFIIAKGDKDGKWHIYEREFDKKGKPKSTMPSLARKYAKVANMRKKRDHMM